MKREIVLSLSGGRILTGSGLRPVAGNLGFGEGAKVFILDNAVIGQQRTQGRKKRYDDDNESAPSTSPLGYRLADPVALKMFLVNSALEVQSEEDIAPVPGFTLLAHAYNKSAEYLIWFNGARCIIQKNQEIVADILTNCPSVPEHCDAQINADGNLEWVVGCKVADAPIWYLARFENGAIQASAQYELNQQQLDDAITESEDRLVEQIGLASYSVQPHATTTTTGRTYLARGSRTGLMQIIEYVGSEIA